LAVVVRNTLLRQTVPYGAAVITAQSFGIGGAWNRLPVI
jgi:hypothetical protein